ncbi:LCP family protein [Rothia sp. ZJ1223]|uniref:LCP family protein n=1 Tax=Rothia sp. ZJ1223 TaxID=2811098 RepID=UPI00195EDF09|nr:LCP family protein [Rothia sp. ZJ1223]MBM7050532.1 LCP family protein [Rothia sp. ZJ1223]
MASHQDKGYAAAGRHMRQQPQRSHRFRWLALAVVASLVFVLGLGGFVFLRLQNNVQTAALNLGEKTAELENGALDILVIGSDTRAGANADYGDESDRQSAARSDVMMLVQVSKDRKRITSLSFPRDLMVDIPQCTDTETDTVYPATEDTQINESLSRGGPGCTVATISKITGVNIDHFMLVDFNAVKSLSQVVGGVQVCVTQEIDDSYSGLKLPAGISTVEGEQALSFLRSRHGFGDGSDTGRIQAQQGFMAALLRKVQAEGTLTNPGMLLNIAEAITQNVTVDEGLTNVRTLAGMGAVFGQVDLGKVVFATVPTEPYELDTNKLQLSTEASTVFKKLRNDESLIEPAPEPEAASEEKSAETPATEEIVYQTLIEVNVLNASGADNREEHIVKLVESLDYSAVSGSESDIEYAASSISYPYGFEAEAQQIAEKLGITAVAPSGVATAIEIIIGTDFAEGDVLGQSATEIAGGATGQTADQVTCQQSFSY